MTLHRECQLDRRGSTVQVCVGPFHIIMKKIKVGRYKHFKGKEYEVIGLAKHSETLEEFVVYRALYGNKDLWIRPKKMFLEKVQKEGKSVKRFRYIGNE